jgi:hypothetical protein
MASFPSESSNPINKLAVGDDKEEKTKIPCNLLRSPSKTIAKQLGIKS